MPVIFLSLYLLSVNLAETYDILLFYLQVTLPASEDTLYWCKIFRLPNIRRRQHMVRVSIVLY
jgi:hypothetical protein